MELWKQTAMWSILKPLINEAKLFSVKPNLEKDKSRLADWYILQSVGSCHPAFNLESAYYMWWSDLEVTQFFLKTGVNQCWSVSINTRSPFLIGFSLYDCSIPFDSSQNVKCWKILLQGWTSSPDLISAQWSPYPQLLQMSIPAWNETALMYSKWESAAVCITQFHILKNSPLVLKKKYILKESI